MTGIKRKRIAVCLNDYSDNTVLLDEAIKMADSKNCQWFAIYIESDSNASDPISKQRVERAFDFAKESGAEIIRLRSENIAEGIIIAAELYNINDVIIGQSQRSGIISRLKPTLSTKLSKLNAPFALKIITLENRTAEHTKLHRLKAFRAYLASAIAIILLTVILEIIQESTPEYKFNASIYNVSMVYLLAIVFCAFKFGFKPALLASVLSFGLYNFFFITPFYEFGLNQLSDVINFALFLSASIISVAVANTYNKNMASLKEREFAASALHDLSKDITGEGDIRDVTNSLGEHLREIIRSDVILFIHNTTLKTVFPQKTDISKKVIQSARDVYTHQAISYENDWGLYPMSTARKHIGVVAVKGTNELINDRLIEALSYQVAIAVERTQLMQEAKNSKLKHERETLRSALLSSVSHDLKTPLVSIIGSLSSVKHMKHSLTEKEQDELIATATEEAERLNQSISNILSMTKIESGDLSPNEQWIEPGSLFSDAMQRLSSQLQNHQIQIKKPDKPFLIFVDPVLFTQLMQNLLENAAKYTPQNSEISFSYTQKGEKALLEYRDNGPGIPRQEHQRVLNKFTRLETRDAKIAGTGLGLAICKAIIDLHNGSITVRNNPEEQGLSIIIRLEKSQRMKDQS